MAAFLQGKVEPIDAAVPEVINLLAPKVLRTRSEIDQDRSDGWAIFFRVLLSDEAGDERNLGESHAR